MAGSLNPNPSILCNLCLNKCSSLVVPVYKFDSRLANKLFIFAHLIAFSEEHKINVRYPPFIDSGKFFKGTVNDVHSRYPPKKSLLKFNWLRLPIYVFYKGLFKPFRIYKPFDGPFHSIVSADEAEFSWDETESFDMKQPGFLAMAREKWIVFLNGRFFRDYSSFEKHQDLIRNFFEPIDSIQTRIDRYFKKATAGVDLVIGVHIRGEDYREFEGGIYFYSQDKYGEKVEALATIFSDKKVRFILCSNDPIDLRHFKNLDVMLGPGDPMGDLYTLAKCDYIIGPPSSFSLWASFYGRKPLCHMWKIDMVIRRECFEILPPEKLFNWTFPHHGYPEAIA